MEIQQKPTGDLGDLGLSSVLAAVHAEDVVMWHKPQVLVQRLATTITESCWHPKLFPRTSQLKWTTQCHFYLAWLGMVYQSIPIYTTHQNGDDLEMVNTSCIPQKNHPINPSKKKPLTPSASRLGLKSFRNFWLLTDAELIQRSSLWSDWNKKPWISGRNIYIYIYMYIYIYICV